MRAINREWAARAVWAGALVSWTGCAATHRDQLKQGQDLLAQGQHGRALVAVKRVWDVASEDPKADIRNIESTARPLIRKILRDHAWSRATTVPYTETMARREQAARTAVADRARSVSGPDLAAYHPKDGKALQADIDRIFDALEAAALGKRPQTCSWVSLIEEDKGALVYRRMYFPLAEAEEARAELTAGRRPTATPLKVLELSAPVRAGFWVGAARDLVAEAVKQARTFTPVTLVGLAARARCTRGNVVEAIDAWRAVHRRIEIDPEPDTTDAEARVWVERVSDRDYRTDGPVELIGELCTTPAEKADALTYAIGEEDHPEILATLLGKLGDAYQGAGRWAPAGWAYENAARRDPREYRYIANTGRAYARRSMAAQALPWLERAYGMSPGDSETALELGLAQDALGAWFAARKYLRRAATLGNVRARQEVARIEGKELAFCRATAAEEERRGSSKITDAGRALFTEADRLAQQDKTHEAEAAYARAVVDSPGLHDVRFNFAVFEAARQDYAEAVLQMSCYLLLAPDAADAEGAKQNLADWQLRLRSR